MHERLRGNKKAVKLLLKAISLLIEGKNVCVITSRENIIPYINVVKFSTEGIKSQFSFINNIFVKNAEDSQWDWDKLEYNGLDENTVYLIDPTAIKSKFNKVLGHFHMFD